MFSIIPAVEKPETVDNDVSKTRVSLLYDYFTLWLVYDISKVIITIY